MAVTPGKLWVVPTPLGNLKDLTFRALETLRTVDLIAAETPSVSLKLLSHYGVQKPLLTFREQNRENASRRVIEALKEGKTVALISDAGTPGVSDPGAFLIERVIAEELPFDVLPGPAALIPAWALSGMLSRQMAFWGFPPRKSGERKEFFRTALNFPGPVIFYEAPQRLPETLKDLETVAPKAQTAVVREISKLYQEVRRGNPQELLEFYRQNPPRGEIVLVVEGKAGEAQAPALEPAPALAFLREKGLSLKDASEFLARFAGANKKAVYRLRLKS